MSSTARQLPPGFDDLTVEEQIDYVQFLWERIAPKVDEHPIPAWHHDVLDDRLRQIATNPDAPRPADEVVARLREGLQKG